MGTVDYTFNFQRHAKLYVEKFKKEGKVAADNWWIQSKWKPDEVDFKLFNDEIMRLIKQS